VRISAPLGFAVYVRDLSLGTPRPHYTRRQRKNKEVRVTEITESDLSNLSNCLIYHACEQMDGTCVCHNMRLFPQARADLRG
jgi:hypothetical protein